MVVACGELRAAVQGYLASISHADTLVGGLMQALDSSPHAGSTIVVFWSDNGYHFGEKQRMAKRTLWDRAAHVPLIVAAPGVTQPGSRCERPVDLMSLYPTLVELCGLPAKSENEGVSIVPLLRDPAAKWEYPALTTHGRGNHAVRSGRWRYIRYANGDEELYDHQADQNEWKNLAGRAEYQDVKKKLRMWLPKR